MPVATANPYRSSPTALKERACDGKVAHATRPAALRAATKLAEDEGVDRYAVAAYECAHCGAWHVGHRSLEQRLRRLRRHSPGGRRRRR